MKEIRDANLKSTHPNEDKARLSGSYQVSGWAVNGRELAGTPTHPPFFSDQHCDDRDDIDDHHLRMR